MSQHKRVFITTVADEDCDNVDVVLRPHSSINETNRTPNVVFKAEPIRSADAYHGPVQLLSLRHGEGGAISRSIQQPQPRFKLDNDCVREQSVLCIEESDGIIDDHHDNGDLAHSGQRIMGQVVMEDPSADMGVEHDDDVPYEDDDNRCGTLEHLSYPSHPVRSNFPRISTIENAGTHHQSNLRSLLSAAEQLKYQQLISRSNTTSNNVHISPNNISSQRGSAQVFVENGRLSHLSTRDELNPQLFIRRTSPGDLGVLHFSTNDPVNDSASVDDDTSTQDSTLGAFDHPTNLNMSHLSPNERTLSLTANLRATDANGGGVLLSALSGGQLELDGLQHPMDKGGLGGSGQQYSYSTPEYKGRPRKHPYVPGKYPCEYCGWRCAKPSVLKKHIRSHTNERPYPCRYCNISFKTKSNLSKHEKSKSHISMMNELKIQANTASQATEDVAMLCRRLEETEAHRDTFTRQDALLEALTRGSRSTFERSGDHRSAPLDPLPFSQSNSMLSSVTNSQSTNRQSSAENVLPSEFTIGSAGSATASQLSAMRLPRGQPLTGVLQYHDDNGVLRHIRVRVQVRVNEDGDASLEWVGGNGSVVRSPTSSSSRNPIPLSQFRVSQSEERPSTASNASLQFSRGGGAHCDSRQIQFDIANNCGKKSPNIHCMVEDEEQVIVREEDVVCTEEVEVVDHGGGRGRSSSIPQNSHVPPPPLIVHADEEDGDVDVGARLVPMVFDEDDDEHNDAEKEFHFQTTTLLDERRQRLDDDEELKDVMLEEDAHHVEGLSVPILMDEQPSSLVSRQCGRLESVPSECNMEDAPVPIRSTQFHNMTTTHLSRNNRLRLFSQRVEQSISHSPLDYMSQSKSQRVRPNEQSMLTHISAPNVNAYHMPQEVAVNLSSSRNPTRYLLEDVNDDLHTDEDLKDESKLENLGPMRSSRVNSRQKRNTSGVPLDILSGIDQAMHMHKTRSKSKAADPMKDEEEAYAMNEYIVVDEDESGEENHGNEFISSQSEYEGVGKEDMHVLSHDDKTYCRHCDRWIDIGRMKAHMMTHKLAGDDSDEGDSHYESGRVPTNGSSSGGVLVSGKESSSPVGGGPTGPRQYRCAVCNVGFRQIGHLNKHNRSKLHLSNMSTASSTAPTSASPCPPSHPSRSRAAASTLPSPHGTRSRRGEHPPSQPSVKANARLPQGAVTAELSDGPSPKRMRKSTPLKLK